MANKIIKYILTEAGTTPTYIEEGGYYAKANSNASPQDYDLIGATADGSDETALGEFENKAAVKSYLDTFSNWTPYWPGPGEKAPLNQADAATYIWSKKIS